MVNFFGYHFRKLDFALALFDIIICSIGFFIYAWLGLASNDSTTPQLVSPIILSIITGIILWSILFAVGIDSLPNVDKISSFFIKSVVAFGLAIIIIMPLWWALGFKYSLTPFLIIPAIFIQIVITLLARIILLFLPAHIRTENIFVIATNQDKKRIIDLINKSHNQYHIKRCLDISLLKRFPKFKPVFYCKKHNISKVIVGNITNREDIAALVDLCHENISIIDIDTFKEQHVGKVNLKRYYNYNSLINHDFVPSKINAILKRIFDVAISISMLVILSPLLLIIAAIIKLYDGGSIFYTQQRIGKKGKIFNIYKFRSMQENAEKNGAQWASKNDNRITPIGKFMRQTRIDELPQLINILKNDMSIVGPRPERPEFTTDLTRHIQYYNERHRIKPGLTGWSQINMGYGDSIAHAREKLEYDLYYLKYYNLSLDLLILLKTISVVLWPNRVH